METPQVSICPHISNDDQVISMLKKNYGLTVVSLKPLNGYDDRNYHAVVEREHSNAHVEKVCDEGYLVKIVNHVDSKLPDFQMGQKLAMDKLNTAGIKCQEEIKTVEGEFFSSLTVKKDDVDVTYMVSVRTFLNGAILDTETLTSALAYDIGHFVAGISKGLQGLEFKLYEDFLPLWNMENMPKVNDVLHAVDDIAHRKVAEEVLKAFDTDVLARKREFRRGQIHGDLNEQNILVEKTSSGIEICGLLDFQDCCMSYCIYDLGIAIAYMMMVMKSDVPVLDVGGHMLAGYEKVLQLNSAERKCLKTLVASRMVMSLVYGAYYYSLDPSNKYFLVTSHAGWRNLHSFWKTEENVMWNRWNEIIKSYIE